MIIGLDVGGTHTDVVLIDADGLQKSAKVPTRSSDLFQSVLEGLDRITEGVDIRKVVRVVLSTTLTTNAIVQDNLPEVGMIVISGPGIDPEFFRTNRHYYAVSGSIDHRGREMQRLQPAEIEQIASAMLADGIRYVGVVGKFSIRNPSHEMAVAAMLKDRFDKVFLGHRISGNLNFARRVATVFLNASVYPIHLDFFQAVRRSLVKKGMDMPIHLLKADGGTMNFESSIDLPDQTIFSGPAASVMGAAVFAESPDTLVLDIGGTTTDLAVMIDCVPVLHPLGIRIRQYKTLIRSMFVRSIGLGGDSEVKMTNGRLTVGPSRIGPAMIFGGSTPTPTDALCICNLMPHGKKEIAEAGFQPIARDLGMTVTEAAHRVIDFVCEGILLEAADMIRRINRRPVYTIHEIRDGFRVAPQKMLILGGPAPFFAERLQAVSGYGVTVVPRWSVANAIGAALARTTCEVNFFADTEQQVATAPEENFRTFISPEFSPADAEKQALQLLRQKALMRGADPNDLDLEIVEKQIFNMVRGFSTVGKNIRIKAQVKPGPLENYRNALSRPDPETGT